MVITNFILIVIKYVFQAVKKAIMEDLMAVAKKAGLHSFEQVQ